ncbi:NAD(P)H-dependent oxidoreductase subunit E [Tissierella carlieri]|jgi:NADH-quinone oxidoreductase subunit E|uniref:NADH-quinone oxidoreductase subunit NuoE family protein n=1 Tax=Tissierella TaxID=41273 RepID=UPI000BA187B0|nr:MULTISPECIES: NAD(P)H-dependent oxidoreductase subunit E [Tissierella]MBU5313780.1 NAD(P)H-dependent oxidoreductase subunit E [Tissierella carlieri]MDU5080172.1 NAD(P)H-dependent oxidoreductase subunit E [Bacillota bacterium]OZV13189.1 NAD(P)H-dependent oxidoreductase subunit E [Tissierella sp. P1]
MLTVEMKDTINEIVMKHGSNQSSIITILQEIQGNYRYLPEEVLEYIANKMDISPSKIFGIATFYENFSLKPKGKYVIKICDGTACHVRKSIPILSALQKELGLDNEKHTTDDLMFTVETVSCLGACGLAPVLNINDKVYGKMTPESTVELLNKLREEA